MTINTFTTTYYDLLKAFGKANGSGSAFGKWVLSQIGSTSGFWGGADYDFYIALNQLVRAAKAMQAKRGRAVNCTVVCFVDSNGNGKMQVGSTIFG